MARNFGGATANNIRRSSSIISQTDPRPVSISCWLYPFSRTDKGNGNSHWIFTNNYADGNPRFGLAVSPSSAVDILRLYSGGYAASSSTFTLAVNTWIHLGLTWDAANNLVFYVNGVATGTGTPAIAGSSTNNVTAIGTLEGTLAGFQIDGRLAHFAAWSAILTAPEFAALAGGINPQSVRRANLAVHLPLWGVHSPEIDLVGGATWSVNGTVLQANHAPVAQFSRRSIAPLPVTGGASFTGTAAVTWPVWTVAATGVETFSGSTAVTLPPWTVSGAGSFTAPGAVSGTIAVTLAPWVVSASGAETFTGTAAVALPTWSVAAQGNETFAGAASLTWPIWTVAASGAETYAGVGAVIWPTWRVAATSQPLRDLVWTAGAAGGRWTVGALSGRWAVGQAGSRWRIREPRP